MRGDGRECVAVIARARERGWLGEDISSPKQHRRFEFRPGRRFPSSAVFRAPATATKQRGEHTKNREQHSNNTISIMADGSAWPTTSA